MAGNSYSSLKPYPHSNRGKIKFLNTYNAPYTLSIKLGFRFHHALERYVMLTKWLPTDQPNHLPTFATHCTGTREQHHVYQFEYLITGAVGFVVNDKHEVLLVQKGVHSSGPHLWKYPEGVANLGEEAIPFNISALSIHCQGNT